MARPRTAPNRLQICLDDDLTKRVEAFRFDQRFESESGALRALVELGLEAAAAKVQRRRGFQQLAGWSPPWPSVPLKKGT